jgi:hypothetical protein
MVDIMSQNNAIGWMCSGILLMVLALSLCSGCDKSDSAPAKQLSSAPQTGIIGTWKAPGGWGPKEDMTFSEDGTLLVGTTRESYKVIDATHIDVVGPSMAGTTQTFHYGYEVSGNTLKWSSTFPIGETSEYTRQQ